MPYGDQSPRHGGAAQADGEGRAVCAAKVRQGGGPTFGWKRTKESVESS